MRLLLVLCCLVLLPLPAPASAHETWAAGYFFGTSTNASAPLIHVVLRVGALTDGYHEGQLEVYPIDVIPPFPATPTYPVRVFFHNLHDGQEGGIVLDVNSDDSSIQLLGAQTTDDSPAPLVLAGFLADYGAVVLPGFVGEA